MKIVGIGEIVWDMLPSGKQLGGAPVNFLFFAKELGAEAYPISAVGTDELGDETLKCLEKTGLPLDYIQRNELPTSRVLVTLNDAGVPSYEIVKNVAWDNIECTPQAVKLVSDADAVCWGTLAQRSTGSCKAVLALVDACPSTCKKVFDINIRQNYYTKELIAESLKRTDILKLNEDELPLLQKIFNLSENSAEAISTLISEYSIEYVLYTQGALCSEIYDRTGCVSYLKTLPTKKADTVGAGDSFTAAFVSALLKGSSVKEAHSLAVGVGAYVCSRSGAINPLPAKTGDITPYCDGLQHIGIPSSNIDETEKFYLGLGFSNIYTTKTDDGKVCFLKMGNLVIEAYQSKQTAGAYGAIDHIALNVKEIESLYVSILRSGYKILEDGIHYLPFWDNGIRYFIIEGPDKVKIEFSQQL